MLGKSIPASGGGYFRLFPYALTRRLLARAVPRRQPIAGILSPSVGDRSRAAAAAAGAAALAVSPLPEPQPHRAAPASSVARIRLDAHGPAVPDRAVGAVSTDHGMDGSSQVAVRPFRPDDSGRWDDFVRACAAGTFFHLSPWRRVIERAFGHRTHYLLAERAGNLTGVLPLTHVKSALFGSSLIANAFGVQGGPIAADDASMQRARRRSRAADGQARGAGARNAGRIEEPRRLADQVGALRDLPQGRSIPRSKPI